MRCFLLVIAYKTRGKKENFCTFEDLSFSETPPELLCCVSEPVPMATLLCLAAGTLLLLLILVCFTVYAMRREKCCFARKYALSSHLKLSHQHNYEA
jgi:hypothetical protein